MRKKCRWNMNYIKYPRTQHLPWSEGISSDDRVLKDTKHFENKTVIVTEKMDGENTTMYNNGIHARSLSSVNHGSRTWVKSLHSKICSNIPNGWRIVGENLFAKHSIHYKDLKSYFLVFGIYNDNECLCWDDTIEYCAVLGLETVPVLYRGPYNEDIIKQCYRKQDQEGYVLRLDTFKYEDFSKSVAKFVRKNHVQTSSHWMNEKIVQNLIGK